MNKNGFTLLELIFTISLASILLMYSFSSLFDLKQKNEREYLVNEIANAITYAKIQASASGHALLLSAKNSNWSMGMELLMPNKVKQNSLIHQWNWNINHWNVEWRGINGQKYINLSGNTQAMSNGRFILTNNKTQEKVILYLNRLGRVKQI